MSRHLNHQLPVIPVIPKIKSDIKIIYKNIMSANNNQLQLEVLQPDISGQIIQTNLEELKNWINEGKLQPYHQVRVRNLSWMEARKIPVLKPLFESLVMNRQEQSGHFYSQAFPDNFAPAPFKPNADKPTEVPSKNNKPKTVSEDVENPKNTEPSAVFKAFEKKALAKSAQIKSENTDTGSKTLELETKIGQNKPHRIPSKKPKKSSAVTKTLLFSAGCVLMILLSLGGSYLWVYQLKTPAEIDEKNLPELAGLEYKLTSEKLDLRLKEAAKESGSQENISQKIAQLEKSYETRRKASVENHRNKLKDADFTATFSYSSVVLLALFFMGRIFYGKTSAPVENRFSSKQPAPQSSAFSDFDEPDIEIDNISEIFDAEESSGENEETSAEEQRAKSYGKTENSDVTSDISETTAAEIVQTTAKCFLHTEKNPAFVCEDCDKYYCDECLKNSGKQEKCCPFCKAVCKPVEPRINKSPAEKNKKVNLLELSKDSDFVVYDYPEERSRAAGVIQAFVIAVLFSAAVSILWAYKVSPYLENRNTENTQNTSPNKAENSAQQTAGNNPKITADTETNTAEDKPCIDPETGQPFECDAETRRALFEHTKKVESIEKAKKDVDTKTKFLTGATSEDSSPENAQQENTDLKGAEKQQLIKVFLISFAIVFGILLSIVFFSKDKKSFLAREDTAKN